MEENIINDNKLNKKKSVKKNYFYNLIYQLFLIIVPLVLTPYVSRVLTTEGVGQYSFSYSLILYFTIFGQLGFTIYAQREIAKHQGDKYNQSKSFWEINICRMLPVSLAFITNLILCLLNVYGDYNKLMFIFLINIGALYFDIAYFFQGNEEFGKICIRNIIIKSLSIACVFIFVKNINDLWLYALILSLSVILSNISLWTYMPKRLCKVNIKELKPLSHLKGTFILFLPTIATSIYTVLDKTLIGLIITDTYTVEEDGVEIIKKVSDLENGYYEQSEKLIKMVMTVITCIGTVMIPRNTKELSLGNYDKVKENITLSSKIVMLIALPMILGIVVVSPFVVPWFFGSGYDKCVILMQILSPLIIIIGFSNVFGLQYLIPAGKDFKYTIAVTIGAIVNLILNSIFIYFWWSIGAAIATIIAECFVTIIMAIMVRKELNIFKVILSSWKAIISSVIMFVAIFFIAKKLDHNVLNTFIIIGIGALIYLTLIILLKDKIVLSTIKKIFNKFKKKKENKDENIQQ